MATVRTLAGRPEGVSERGKPTKFAEAAEWTGGFADGADADARFRCPGGVCEAEDGTIYVSDAYNHVIRKRAPGDAAWTTVCGLPGEKGLVDGKGEEVRLSYPQRIALDASGNIVVAGGGSHSIHLVTPGGEVSTLAGVGGSAGHTDGQGADARFNRPIGLAIDHVTGDIFVGEAGGQVIRKITRHGHVSTLAGVRARVSVRPVSCARHAFEKQPRRRSRSNSKHTSITISGKYKEKGCVDGKGEDTRFDQPCGLALSTDGSVCTIADCNNHVLRRLLLKDLSVETLAGKPGEAGHADGFGDVVRFHNPSDLVLDADGAVIVVHMCWYACVCAQHLRVSCACCDAAVCLSLRQANKCFVPAWCAQDGNVCSRPAEGSWPWSV
jgi:DNA-binding beta-propeller fold protein YncE